MLAISLTGAVDYDGFAQAGGLSLAGDARVEGKVLRVAPSRRMQAGAAWHGEPVPVLAGFETEFVFRFANPGGNEGADGLAFVIQNTGPRAVAGVGRSGGFALSTEENRARGISRSLAVFFDTYKNAEEDDPSGNYVALCATGDGYWPRRRLQHSGKLKVNLEDGREHRARIVYEPPRLTVWLDEQPAPVLRAAVALAEIVGNEKGTAWVGFTASTGNGYADHDVLRWRLTQAGAESRMLSVESRISFGGVAEGASGCLPGHTLCTPPRASVEAAGAGRWRVVLPANQEWGASVPAGKVTIGGAGGVVCWSPDEDGRAVCNGPEGGGKAGRGFVQGGRPAGALMMRVREGRTWFSVNDRAGAFGDNEGFFEFEVEGR